ncbi:hypothetical protein [Chlorobium phaeovibrioides]|uniref:Uncharacterized protein n=1 Tax=Chlorobium phaeovibrioides TaxID=1094 RepID=A0A5M8I7L7_CHLPH|nr:hypothetical protein [Chlorobium phaeovibrioides]KAA6230372.1 hypothetical protein FP507_10905 [Chlorobium phaeovibrioides]MWV54982.1 hypothetical protein [Chlorobium phaeovibrioides]
MSSADEKPEGKWNFENEETGQTAPISKGQGELFGFTQRDIDEMTNPEPISYVSTWNEKNDTSTRTFSAILKEWTPDKEAELYGRTQWGEACRWLTEEARRQRPDDLAEWGEYPAPRFEVTLSQEYTTRPFTNEKSGKKHNIPYGEGPVDVGVRLIPDYSPPLTAEAAEDLRLMMAAYERARKEDSGAAQPRKRQKKRIAGDGGVVELPKNIVNTTGKDYKNALSSKRKGKAFLIPLQDGELETMEVDEVTGRLSLKGDRWMETIELKNLRTREVVGGRALAFIRTLYTIVVKHGEQIQNGRYHVLRVYKPILCEHLGMTAYPANIKDDVVTRIREEMKDIVGYLADGKSYYPAFSFLGYNNEDNTVDIAVPYLSRLVSEIQNDPDRRVLNRKGELVRTKPAHSETIHGSIANEKDHIAIAIVFRIDALIHSRPNTKETVEDENGKKAVVTTKGATQNISFKTLLADVPEFSVGYDAQTNAKQKNKFLDRHLTNAYRIIREKTDLCSYFINLRWYWKETQETDPIPSTTILSRLLYFTHDGVNPEWKRPR